VAASTLQIGYCQDCFAIHSIANATAMWLLVGDATALRWLTLDVSKQHGVSLHHRPLCVKQTAFAAHTSRAVQVTIQQCNNWGKLHPMGGSA
jgi:hypothetical protein